MSDLAFETQQTAEGTISMIRLEGELTILTAAALRDTLMKAFEAADGVRVNTEQVEAIDLSCLQLLCSAHRTALALNKSFLFETCTAPVIKAAEAAGFTRHTGCSIDISQSCIWSGGTR